MRVMLFVQDLELPSGKGPWWRREKVLGPLLETLAGSPLWRPLAFAGRDGAKLKPFADAGELAAAWRGWKGGSMYRLGSEEEGEDGVLALVRLHESALTLRLVLDAAGLATMKKAKVDVVAAGADLLRALAGHGHLGPSADLRVVGVDFEDAGKLFDYADPEAIVTAIDPRWWQAAGEPLPAELATLMEVKLPSWAKRRREGEVVIVRWLLKLGSEKKVAEALARTARFLAETLDGEDDSERNEHGDPRVDLLVPADDAGLTVYDQGLHAGYQAVVPGRGGKLDLEALEQPLAWRESLELPDGQPLESLTLILPSREAALRVADAGLPEGIDGAVYIDGDGILWDPAR